MPALISAIRSLVQPLEPVPTGTKPYLPKFEGIKAVVFDVYGTLIISSSGDISLAQKQDREEALRAALTATGLDIKSPSEDLRITDIFYDEVKRAQDTRRKDGIEYPEIEIREIWAAVFAKLGDKGVIGSHPDMQRVERFAVEYECRVNLVWPMPNLANTLNAIKDRGLELGIVSNAQFFTPFLFQALLDTPYRSFGFDDALCVWSFVEREGKPSTQLYKKLAGNLAEQDIAVSETLYIGNDMCNDIWPAQEVGLKTVLFAADERSLRLREDDERCSKVKPDAVVTDLAQILEILG